MPIQPLISTVLANSQTKKPKFNSVSITGYSALGFGMVIPATNKKLKSHKYLGYIAGALAFLHTGIIEGMRFNRRKGEK